MTREECKDRWDKGVYEYKLFCELMNEHPKASFSQLQVLLEQRKLNGRT